MLHIVTYPHPALRHRSKPIRRINRELREIAREMLDLMYEARGIGLAANQVDLPLRLFVANLAGDPEEGEELVYLNPVLSRPKGMDEKEEGCLSLPETYAPVRRPERILFEALDLSGNLVSQELSGLHARVVQHEVDHLDGVLFTDRLGPTAHASVQETLRSFERDFEYAFQSGAMGTPESMAERRQAWEQKFCDLS